MTGVQTCALPILIPHFLFKRRYLLYALLLIGILGITTFFSFSVLKEQDVHAAHYKMNSRQRQHHAHSHTHFNGHLQKHHEAIANKHVSHDSLYSKSHKIDTNNLYSNAFKTNDAPKKITPVKYIILRRMYLYLLVILFAFLLRSRQRHKEAEKARLKTELDALKSHLNPHTLFNLLNGVYAKALAKQPEIADQIFHISQFLRTLLKQRDRDFYTIHEEVDFIKSYCELQKNRFTDQVNIHFSETIQRYDAQIPTLLTLPLIENAFTHLDFNSKEAQITIKIYSEDDFFNLSVSNTYDCNSVKTGNGLGLPGFIKRMEFHYLNEFTYSVVEKNCIYTSILRIPLKDFV